MRDGQRMEGMRGIEERKTERRECNGQGYQFGVLFVQHVPVLVIPIAVRSIPFKFSKSSHVLYPAAINNCA